jgi:hypothetical protein
MLKNQNMKPLEWKTVQIKVCDLIPQADNYKKLPEAKKEKLIQSLTKFNIVDIPVIDFDGVLVSGHQRLVCLIAMGRGEEMIDVRKPNRKLTKEELKEYSLLANNHFGEIDFDLLDHYLSDVDIDLENIGVDLSYISDFKDSLWNDSTPKKPEERELKPFKRTYVLISFPPERVIDIQKELETIAKKDFVEYEQVSN